MRIQTIDYPDQLRLVNGKLICIDGQSVTKYLRQWAIDLGVTQETPLNIIKREYLIQLTEHASRNGIVFCRFCGKSSQEVQKMIAGNNTWICNECIDICNDIIAENSEESNDKT